MNHFNLSGYIYIFRFTPSVLVSGLKCEKYLNSSMWVVDFKKISSIFTIDVCYTQYEKRI